MSQKIGSARIMRQSETTPLLFIAPAELSSTVPRSRAAGKLDATWRRETCTHEADAGRQRRRRGKGAAVRAVAVACQGGGGGGAAAQRSQCLSIPPAPRFMPLSTPLSNRRLCPLLLLLFLFRILLSYHHGGERADGVADEHDGLAAGADKLVDERQQLVPPHLHRVRDRGLVRVAEPQQVDGVDLVALGQLRDILLVVADRRAEAVDEEDGLAAAGGLRGGA